MKVYIYTLADPRNNEIRYIGKANRISKRLKKHLGEKSNSRRVKWISSLKKLGLKPIIEILEEVESIEWQYWEIFYINLFKTWNFDLVNGTTGGEGGPTFKGKTHTNETKDKIKNSIFMKYGKDNYSKLNLNQVNEIRNKFNNNYSIRAIGREYNISATQVGRIVKNKAWTYIAG